MIESTVIADSINSKGVRLTSLQLTYPRFILAELNTHRAFSRSTSSSRAIPVAKLIERVQTEPAMPIHWGQNQRGMQADKEIDEPEKAARLWHEAASRAVAVARKMEAEGVHKQVVNRILEPFVHVSTIVTATDWHNFFILRDHEDAQPEIRELARAMATAMDKSKPTRLSSSQWHLPYITDEEKAVHEGGHEHLLPIMSAARCARVSYLRHDGQSPLIEHDIRLFEQLAVSTPAHMSPLEHQARPLGNPFKTRCRNFRGWEQFRHIFETKGWHNYDAVGEVND